MSLAATARREAERRYESPGFRSAFVRGALAAAARRPIEACPYPRRRRGRRGWSAWRTAWLAGHAWQQYRAGELRAAG